MMKDYLIYAVDFDGTLCANQYPKIGAPNVQLIEYLLKKQLEGVRLILWTCRADEQLQEAVDWCKGFGLEFDAVNDNLGSQVKEFENNTRKVYADVYFDDKSADKAKFNIPFVKESKEYTLGSRWWFGAKYKKKEFIFPCHIEEITKSCQLGEQMLVVSDDKDGNYKFCEIKREPDFFKDKLFHTFMEARKGVNN